MLGTYSTYPHPQQSVRWFSDSACKAVSLALLIRVAASTPITRVLADVVAINTPSAVRSFSDRRRTLKQCTVVFNKFI